MEEQQREQRETDGVICVKEVPVEDSAKKEFLLGQLTKSECHQG